jgi:putative ABC transport system substrate-binding protein
MRRRDIIKIIAVSAVSWPLRARTEAIPVIGFLTNLLPEGRLRAFRDGLKEAGYVEGQNVKIEYRLANDQNDRLPELATELVQRQVTLIVAAGGTVSAVAAKAATKIVPIVFAVAADPVKLGLVASLRKPGGNMTGVTDLNLEIGPKRLELIHELVPTATVIGVLVNPTSPDLMEAVLLGLQPAAHAIGVKLYVLRASTEADLDQVFRSVNQVGVRALVVSPDALFNARGDRLGALSLRYAVPTIYEHRPFAAAGGLISYSSDDDEYYRLVGRYAGKILDGEKPAGLPVMQSTKVEMIINLKTAKRLGIEVPLPIIGRADEVIE